MIKIPWGRYPSVINPVKLMAFLFIFTHFSIVRTSRLFIYFQFNVIPYRQTYASDIVRPILYSFRFSCWTIYITLSFFKSYFFVLIFRRPIRGSSMKEWSVFNARCARECFHRNQTSKITSEVTLVSKKIVYISHHKQLSNCDRPK